MRRHRDQPLSFRLLLLLVGSYLLTVAALLAGSAHLTKERMIDDRVTKLRAVVEVTKSMAELMEADVSTGRLTRAQAIERFRTLVYATRYNGTEYLFVYDLDGTVIAIGNDPETQGQPRVGLRDLTGKPFIQEMVTVVHDGGGTVNYWYPRQPGQPPVQKLAYVTAFVPWNIFIGSGVYIGDIETAFAAYLRHVTEVTLGTLAVAVGLAFWIGRDVAASAVQRRTAEAKFIHLAYHDTLTDLPNRAFFQETLALAISRTKDNPTACVVLLLCDLDRFKEVNDTFGHPAGDELLRQAAVRMRETVRNGDILARLGGDEFALVQIEPTQPSRADALAARIIDVMAQPFKIDGRIVSVGMSIGIALAPADATDPVDLMKHADTALYVSKHRGRGIATLYHPDMSDGMQGRLELEADLRRALSCGEFVLHYQPLVELATRRVAGFEALLRWQHPDRGLLFPDTFIQVAEDCGILVPIGEWVLRRACLDAAGWDQDIRVAANVSSQQFQAADFAGVVISALVDADLPAARLELEITERVMLTDSETAHSALTQLRGLGVQISLDDFGTGYSSLSYLQKFPVDGIKIDRSFVSGLGTTAETEAIVRAMVSLGGILGLRTLAEGIETEEQAARVLATHCVEGQGYLFSRPVPLSDVPAVIDRLGKERSDAMVPSDLQVVP
jgi:diguanylate cyclase (GGDEF)-like protein